MLLKTLKLEYIASEFKSEIKNSNSNFFKS